MNAKSIKQFPYKAKLASPDPEIFVRLMRSSPSFVNDALGVPSQTELQELICSLHEDHSKLENQNKALMTLRKNLERSVRKYTELYDFAPVGYITLSKEGKIE